jgi:hypothetical protein
MVIDGAEVCLEDDWLRRCGPDHVGEPPEVSRAPRGPTRVAPIVSAEERVAPARGSREIPDGIVTRPGEVATGVICDRGDSDRGEIPGAQESSQVQSLTAVGVHAVARLLRNQGGGHDPARIAFCSQVARAPVPTGTRFIDTGEVLGLGWARADAVIEVTRPRAHGPERGDLSPVIVGDRGDRDRVLMDIHANRECARVTHG